MLDIYFEKNYGELYEGIENGTCEVFEYTTQFGKVYHMFIRREIPINIDGEVYYDLVTPYGYGGPLILECIEGFKNRLVEEFEQEFQKYCNRNNIVSEFVRFHPFIKNALDFKDCYEVNHDRNTVGTNLSDFDNPFQEEFSKSCRKNVNKALKLGVSFRVTENPNSIIDFKKIYYSTMDRNKATDYYYFDEDYFNKCIELFSEKILLVEAVYQEQTIAMGLYFIYKDTIHIHLSGTLSEYLYLSPAYILRYGVTMWGKENGYSLIHHGGGRSNNLEDSLYTFKKQFGKNTEFEFYTGKKIWNNDVYIKLCKSRNKDVKDINKDYFPLYRN